MINGSPHSDLTRLAYPAARRVHQADDYHGEKVLDPYRELEDISDPRTAAWVAAQNRLAEKGRAGSDIVHFEVESFTESGILCLRAVARDLSLVAR